MTRQTFDQMLGQIYGTFGRQRPAYSTGAYATLDARVNDESRLPDTAAEYISRAIREYDSLPVNLGKAIMREFGNWLSENPQAKAKEYACPQCDAGYAKEVEAGFFWAEDATGKKQIFKCACNHKPRWAKMPAWTHQAAQRAGYTVVPFKGDTAGDTTAQGHDREAKGLLHRSVGHTEAPRREHMAEMERYGEAVPF